MSKQSQHVLIALPHPLLHLVSLGLVSFIFTLFCCYKFGWGWDNFVKEANEGEGLKVKEWMKPVFKYVVPVIILFIYIYGMVNFNWK